MDNVHERTKQEKKNHMRTMSHHQFFFICNYLFQRNIKSHQTKNREYGNPRVFGITQRSLTSPTYTSSLIVIRDFG